MSIILGNFITKLLLFCFYNTFLNQNTQNNHTDLGQPTYCVGAQFFGLTHKISRSVKYVPEEAKAIFAVICFNDIRFFHEKTNVIELLPHISQSTYTLSSC